MFGVETKDGPDLLSVGGAASSLLTLASANINNAKVRNVAVALSLGLSLSQEVSSRLRSHRSKNSYVIKIEKDDALFPVVDSWLINSLPPAEQRDLLVKSVRIGGYEVELASSSSSPSVSSTIDISYSGDRSQKVTIAGHTVVVEIERPEYDVDLNSSATRVLPKTHFRIECRTFAAQQAVLRRLKEESETLSARTPSFRTATKWGDFRTVAIIPRRPINTVILKERQSESILSDLRNFLKSEEKYVNLGIPYHRGLLLHGEPGTGKTSIASAIAYELGLDVYYVALSSVPDDAALADLLGSVKERSILLLEDVDIAHATKDRTDDGGGVTLSGMLNALDGFMTPHGLITIMTTNRLEVLDPALTRPGRIDISEEISAVDSYQVRELCMRFLGFVPQGLPTIYESDGITASEVVEVFKHHLDCPKDAGPELLSTLTHRVAGRLNNGTAKEEVST